MRLIDLDKIKPMDFPSVAMDGLDVVQYLNTLPTVDAVEVVHGRWITHRKGQNNWCECSECNTVGSPFWKRCPVCEAKMDGGNADGICKKG
jgi:hypothetical protein